MESKKTLVLGATDNPSRYAYIAVKRLLENKQEVVAVSNKKGEVLGIPIQNDFPRIEGVHTVTLYVGTKNLHHYIDYILSLNPKRIIFNPGTAHEDLQRRAKEKGIETVDGCTLVMLSIGNY